MADDDDPPALSAESFAALQEFYAEQAKRQEIFDKLKAEDKLKENVLFDENWLYNQYLEDIYSEDDDDDDDDNLLTDSDYDDLSSECGRSESPEVEGMSSDARDGAALPNAPANQTATPDVASHRDVFPGTSTGNPPLWNVEIRRKRKPLQTSVVEQPSTKLAIRSEKTKRAETRAQRRQERKEMVAESKLRKADEGPTGDRPTQRAGYKPAAGSAKNAVGDPQHQQTKNHKRRSRPRGKRGSKRLVGAPATPSQTQSSKRRGPDGTRSPREVKRPNTKAFLSEPSSTTPVSYADAARSNNLCVAVMTVPFTDMNEEQVARIQQAMHEALDEEIFRPTSSSARAPSFRGKPFLSEGVLKLWCEDDYSLEWLRRTIDRFPSPCPGTRLVVCHQSKIPQRVKAVMFVPEYTEKSTYDLRTRLQRQNPWYEVDKWGFYLVKRQEGKDGVLIVLGIPREQVAIIQSRGRRVSYKYGTAYIKFPREAPDPSSLSKEKVPKAVSNAGPTAVRMDSEVSGDLGPYFVAPPRQPRHSSLVPGMAEDANFPESETPGSSERVMPMVPEHWYLAQGDDDEDDRKPLMVDLAAHSLDNNKYF